jgi:phage terminase large subunit-like protein
MKLKDKEAGDYVVGQCWWRVGGGYWLTEQLRGQWNEATTVNAIALLAVRHPEIKRHVIENTGNGPEVMATLRKPLKGYTVSDEMAGLLGMNDVERAAVQALRRRGMSGLIPNTPKGRKEVRMRAVTPLLEAGDVHLVEGQPYVPGYLDEMAAFPNGSHDDQVDTTSQALSRLSKGSVRMQSSTGAARLPAAPNAVPGGQRRAGNGRRGTIGLPTGRRR